MAEKSVEKKLNDPITSHIRADFARLVYLYIARWLWS